MKTSNNLLISLYRWCNHQGENFATEALTHLLCHLLDDEPEAAASIISTITGSYVKIDPNMAQQVQVTAQPTTEGSRKRPDIEIRYPDCLIFIEVKIDSMFGPSQIGSYLRELQNCGIKNTRLITITKHDYAYHQGDLAEPAPHVAVRWDQLADCLESMLSTQIHKRSGQHFAKQFIEFLIKEVMTMTKVDRDMEPGIRSMVNLVGMVAQALAHLGAQPKLVSSLTYRTGYSGCYFYPNGRKHFLGIYFDKPATLIVNTEYKAQFAHSASPQLGRILQHGYWEDDLDLISAGFFSLTVGDQMKCINDFAKKSVDYINNHVIPV